MPDSKHTFVVDLRAPEEWSPEFTADTVRSAICADLALTDVVVLDVDNTAKQTGEFINDIRRVAEKILAELQGRGRLDDISLDHEMPKIVKLTASLWTRLLTLHMDLKNARQENERLRSGPPKDPGP